MNETKLREILLELKEISNKLKSDDTPIEESIEIFKNGCKLIEKAKLQLDEVEGEVKKVLDNNNLENFNN